jgi:hypothetical protein
MYPLSFRLSRDPLDGDYLRIPDRVRELSIAAIAVEEKSPARNVSQRSFRIDALPEAYRLTVALTVPPKRYSEQHRRYRPWRRTDLNLPGSTFRRLLLATRYDELPSVLADIGCGLDGLLSGEPPHPHIRKCNPYVNGFTWIPPPTHFDACSSAYRDLPSNRYGSIVDVADAVLRVFPERQEQHTPYAVLDHGTGGFGVARSGSHLAETCDFSAVARVTHTCRTTKKSSPPGDLLRAHGGDADASS